MECLQQILFKLLDEGYCFESWIEYNKHIRLYHPKSGFINIHIETMEIKESRLCNFEIAKYPKDIIDSDISFQFLYFVLENIDFRQMTIMNWAGWSEEKIFTIRGEFENRDKIKVNYSEYKNSDFAKKYDEFFPDILQPVSGIICDYAFMPFYDFLSEKFEEFKRKKNSRERRIQEQEEFKSKKNRKNRGN